MPKPFNSAQNILHWVSLLTSCGEKSNIFDESCP